MRATFDVGIVGLGAVGSAALYHASRRNLSVVGFDIFAPPHTAGSSHGGSRIIRRAYFEGPAYVPLLTRAYTLWRDLEQQSDRPLMHLNGCLTIGRAGSPLIEGARQTAEAFAIPFEHLDADAVRRRFPTFHVQEDHIALWEPEAGWLDPEACIHVHLELATGAGAEIRFHEPVRRWIVAGEGIRIETDAGTFDVARLIVCAGGWIARLLKELHIPLHLERQVNAWFRPSAADDRFAPDRCPVFVWEYAPDDVLYGFPDTGDGVKAGLHHGGERVDHPDEIDRDVHPSDLDALRREVRRLLPEATGHVEQAVTCFYTNTPDEHYLIDRHPGLDRVVFASACSGHGFKASSAVGEALVRMATGDEVAVDVSAFTLRRFSAEPAE